jgi:hypothetical protein
MGIEYVPVKRKRRSKRNASLWENDDATSDTVTHVEVEVMTKAGPKRQRVMVPLRDVEEQEQVQSTSGVQDYPSVAPEWDMEGPQVPAEPTLGAEPTRPRVGKVCF